MKYIWQQVFPDAEVRTYCFDDGDDYPDVEPDQQIWFQREKWRWLIGNVGRQILLRLVGLRRMSKVVHPNMG